MGTTDGLDFIFTPTGSCPTGTPDIVPDIVSITSTEVLLQLPLNPTSCQYNLFVGISGSVSCSFVSTDVLEVKPIPLVLYANPSSVYTEIDLSVVILTNGIAAATSIELSLSGNLTSSSTSVAFQAGTEPNTFVFQYSPSLLLDAGFYDITVTTVDGCVGTLENFFTLTSDIGLEIDAVFPSTITNLTSADIEISSPAISVTNTGFTPISRVVLSQPSTGFAIVLDGVDFRSENRLVATVPEGLPLGSYDVVVTTSDNIVGILPDGLLIVDDALPEIYTFSPPFFTGAFTGTITGVNFVTVNSVNLDCRTPDDPATVYTSTGTVTFESDTELVVDFADDTNLPISSVCVVRVVRNDTAEANYVGISKKGVRDLLFSLSLVILALLLSLFAFSVSPPSRPTTTFDCSKHRLTSWLPRAWTTASPAFSSTRSPRTSTASEALMETSSLTQLNPTLSLDLALCRTGCNKKTARAFFRFAFLSLTLSLCFLVFRDYPPPHSIHSTLTLSLSSLSHTQH